MMRMIYGRAGAVKFFLTRQSRAGPSRTRPRVFPLCGFAFKGKRPDGGFRAIRAMAARGVGTPGGGAHRLMPKARGAPRKCSDEFF